MKLSAPLVLSGLVALLPGLACREHPTTAPTVPALPKAAVQAQIVRSQSRSAHEDVVGTVQPKLQAILEAKVSGRITALASTPGQAVQAGELLVELDAREIQARLDQATATREQSGRDRERLRGLLAQNAISVQEFENADSRHRVAVAAVAEAETMLGYTKITAPFSGVVTRKLADVGDLAAPGRPLLELNDPTHLRVETGIPESLIQRVQLGARLSVRTSLEDPPRDAVVAEIAPSADPASRTFQVKLDLPPHSGLRAGQFARVAVPLGERPTLLVPKTSVQERGQMELVFVITNQTARLRLVKTGPGQGGLVEVVSGISAGETVVSAGAETLRDGQPVEVK